MAAAIPPTMVIPEIDSQPDLRKLPLGSVLRLLKAAQPKLMLSPQKLFLTRRKPKIIKPIKAIILDPVKTFCNNLPLSTPLVLI
ncbi:hypothetical protein D3C87_1958090 [compost metagenome]